MHDEGPSGGWRNMWTAPKGKTTKSVNIGVGWLVGRDLSFCQLHCGLTTAATSVCCYYCWLPLAKARHSAHFAEFRFHYLVFGCDCIVVALESSVFSIQLENMQHSEFGTDRTVIVYSSGRISGGAAASVRVAGQRVLADTSSCHRARPSSLFTPATPHRDEEDHTDHQHGLLGEELDALGHLVLSPSSLFTPATYHHPGHAGHQYDPLHHTDHQGLGLDTRLSPCSLPFHTCYWC